MIRSSSISLLRLTISIRWRAGLGPTNTNRLVRREAQLEKVSSSLLDYTDTERHVRQPRPLVRPITLSICAGLVYRRVIISAVLLTNRESAPDVHSLVMDNG